MEVMEWIALTEEAIKGRNHKLLREFVFQHGLGEGRIGCINSDILEFAVVRHTRFFNSLLYELVEILDTDECPSSPSRLIKLILRVGMGRT